jgi:PST family polysaccharide transporter
LLGPRWASAGPLLCVFAVRGIANSVERTMGWLHVVAGRSDRWMRWGVFSAACQLVALGCGLPFGAMGVAIAYTIAMFLLFLPALVYAGRPINVGVKDVLSATAPQMTSALVAIACAISVQGIFFMELPMFLKLLGSVATCLGVYLVMVLGVFRATGPFKIAFSLLHDFPLLKRRA